MLLFIPKQLRSRLLEQILWKFFWPSIKEVKMSKEISAKWYCGLNFKYQSQLFPFRETYATNIQDEIKEMGDDDKFHHMEK